VLEGIVVTQWHGDGGLLSYFSPQGNAQVTTTRWAFLQRFFTSDFHVSGVGAWLVAR
jgi:hypothetical protein